MPIAVRLRRLLQRLLALLASLLPAALRLRLLLRPWRPAHVLRLGRQRDPQQTQLHALRQIVADNRHSEFGRAHDFGHIDDVERLRSRVPVRAHDQLLPYLQRQQAGERDVLLCGPLCGLLHDESWGRRRTFPVGEAQLDHWRWTERVLRHVALARHPQVGDRWWLELLPGPPAARPAAGAAAWPVASSAVTLLARSRAHIDRAAAGGLLPAAVFDVEDEQARYYLALRLAIGQPVSVLRAWAPGTLAILAQHLERLGEQLIDDVAAGRVAHVERLGARQGQLDQALRQAERPDRRRAAALRGCLSEHGYLWPTDAWPDLRLLVCPTGGPARAAVERLGDRFGDLPLLDPGCSITEAPITWPIESGEAGALVLGGQFWEFLPAGASDPVPPPALQAGQRYRPVLTSAAGLYRYAMDLTLEATENRGGVPLLVPVGRGCCSVQLDGGGLDGDTLAEAVAAASRSCELALSGYSGWIARDLSVDKTAPHLGAAVDDQADRTRQQAGWLARLLSRGESGTAGTAEAALVLAIEPAAELDEALARRLLTAIDQALRDRCPVYSAERDKRRLAGPRALLLCRGVFARRARQRVARGQPDAHGETPPLMEHPLSLSEDEVALHVAVR